MSERPQISTINMKVNGTDVIYDIKDAYARELLEALFSEEFLIDGGTAPINNEENV